MQLNQFRFFAGAVATSAPVLAQLDFQQYLEVVSASLKTTGTTCTENIANATMKLQSLVTSEEGREQLSKKFRLVHLAIMHV